MKQFTIMKKKKMLNCALYITFTQQKDIGNTTHSNDKKSSAIASITRKSHTTLGYAKVEILHHVFKNNSHQHGSKPGLKIWVA